MIYGIGVDTLSTARLEALEGRYDDPFFRKTYTDAEYSAGISRRDPIVYFSERFAAKEAVFKALNITSTEFRFNEIETLNDDTGKPYVNLYGCARRMQDEAGVRHIHISLSSGGGYVTAFAVCEK